MKVSQIGVKPPKGFRDISPFETLVRDRLINTIVATYRSYGFERVETPVVEDIRRLKHSEGGENLGLMFKIMKRGDKLDLQSAEEDIDNLVDLALRYDLTVPISRYYAQHRAELPPVFKSIQIGPVWRAERPQKDRYRQFTQCDIDVFGGSAPADEVELITVTLETLNKLGIKGVTVRINDRRLLSAMVHYAGFSEAEAPRALINLDKMDKVGLEGVREAFIKDGFDSQKTDKFIQAASDVANIEQSEQLISAAGSFAASLQDEVIDSLKVIIETTNKVQNGTNSVVYDPFLVRGMGYYTGPVFEIHAEGISGSLAGGGRYDNLIGKLSGNDATACGFSIGFERLTSLLVNKEAGAEKETTPKVAVIYDNTSESLVNVLSVVQNLKSSGGTASMYAAPKNMKRLLSLLKDSGYTAFVRVRDGVQSELTSLTD